MQGVRLIWGTLNIGLTVFALYTEYAFEESMTWCRLRLLIPEGSVLALKCMWKIMLLIIHCLEAREEACVT